ncbi:piggyBac transposable element-derived protein 4-like [Nilaparvata lugens]|uniref:piggyBac transposable element-derived protein 4-like n=1 Tax=Nilaparvata lugens TaxID=108931 RepID=UPI00193E15F8|nr:piggyBac transposable element-derived protein 4-like [Nilaparvata lugens]
MADDATRRQELLIEQWLREEEIDNDLIEECSNDEESDFVEVQQENSDTEEEASDEDDDDSANGPHMQGKDGTKWLKHVPEMRGRTRQHNIVFRAPGPKGEAKQKNSNRECLDLFLDGTVIHCVTEYTNIRIESVRARYASNRDDKLTDELEITGYLGILYLIGTLKSGRQNVEQIFDTKNGTGIEAVYLTMGVQRFKFLTRNIRFDDINTRTTRIKEDKLAPIRELFEKIVGNFQKNFIPSAEMTLDEQLIAFRGKCSFRQFIPSKPAKYGIKIFALVDVHFPYTFNLEVYCGVQPEGPFKVSNEHKEVVMRMTAPIHGSNRNVTSDNWFSSLDVAKELFAKKTTMVGTVRKDKREVPLQLRTAKGKPIPSSIFGFHGPCTLVSYIPKKVKLC